eukprot:5414627-Alexandrium_andersonii.AAC.1
MRPPEGAARASFPARARALKARSGRFTPAIRNAARHGWCSFATSPERASPRLGTRPPSAAQ